MAPTFIFIRHGEAEHNVAFHTIGLSAFTKEEYRDAPLTEKGKEQGRTLASKLKEYKILDIWSSPLTRAIQTAEELFEELDCGKINLHDNLLELLGGGNVCNERKSKHDIKKAYGHWTTTYLADTPAQWITFENPYALQQRMLMFVMLMAEIYKDAPPSRHLIVVSHANALAALTGEKLENAECKFMTFDEIMKSQ
jgi:broad specificity phosphatase PhoE